MDKGRIGGEKSGQMVGSELSRGEGQESKRWLAPNPPALVRCDKSLVGSKLLGKLGRIDVTEVNFDRKKALLGENSHSIWADFHELAANRETRAELLLESPRRGPSLEQNDSRTGH